MGEDSSATTTVVPVAILVVGSEVLSGRVPDTNSHWLAQELWRLGCLLTEVCTVPDDLHVISQKVKLLSETNKFLITTGGIGPTHDDVTFEAVALAFQCQLHAHPDILSVLQRLIGASKRLEAAHYKCATVPTIATLLSGSANEYPVVRVHNVFILPGAPYLVRTQFRLVCPVIAATAASSTTPKYMVEVRVAMDEVEMVPSLNRLVSHHPRVDVGSYPQEVPSDRPDAGETIITLEASERGLLIAAENELRELLGPGLMVQRIKEKSTALSRSKDCSVTASCEPANGAGGVRSRL